MQNVYDRQTPMKYISDIASAAPKQKNIMNPVMNRYCLLHRCSLSKQNIVHGVISTRQKKNAVYYPKKIKIFCSQKKFSPEETLFVKHT